MVFGGPIFFPGDLSDDAIARACDEVSAAIDACTRRAEEMLRV
jgi:hypothetical protein